MSFFVGEATIYALVDQNDNVFYVGATVQELEKRIAAHLQEATKNRAYTNILKNKAIRDSDYKISAKVLQTVWVTGKNAALARRKSEVIESMWIRRCLELGYKLTNRTYTKGDYYKGSKERIRRLVKTGP